MLATPPTAHAVVHAVYRYVLPELANDTIAVTGGTLTSIGAHCGQRHGMRINCRASAYTTTGGCLAQVQLHLHRGHHASLVFEDLSGWLGFDHHRGYAAVRSSSWGCAL